MKTVDYRTFEEKFYDFKFKTKTKVQNGLMWANNNKTLLLIVVPMAIGGVGQIVKVAGKRANLNKEEQLKTMYCYDRSLGTYWNLRRELTNDEWLRVDERKQAGERLGDILDSMEVLK